METLTQEPVGVCTSPNCEVLGILGEMGLKLTQSRNTGTALQGIVPLVTRITGVETWGLFLASHTGTFRLTVGQGRWRCVAWVLDVPESVLNLFVQDRRTHVTGSSEVSSSAEYEAIRHLTEKKPSMVIGFPIWSGRRLTGVLLTVSFPDSEAPTAPVRLQALEVLAETIGLAMGRDTSARVWRARAFHDPLTGVLNRRGFDYWFHRWTLLAQEGVMSFCLVLIDLDRFKEVNDHHGHPAGDLLLTTIAHVLDEQKRSVDRVARLGGDEFALLLSNVTKSAAHSIVNRLKVRVKTSPVTVQGSGALLVGKFSYGISQSFGTTTEPILVFSQADQDLYHHKKEGGLIR